MSRYCDHRHLRNAAGFGYLLAEIPDDGPWLGDGQEDIGPDPQPVQQRLVELPGGLVHHPGSGGDGVFADFVSSKHIGKQIGDEQDLVRMPERGEAFLLLGIQLEDGVEIHDLYACGAVQFLTRDAFEQLFRNAVGIRVAVCARAAQQGTVVGHESEIHAPGVDTYGINPHAFAAKLPEALAEVVIYGEDVPIILAAEFDYAAGKTVHFLHREGTAGERGQDRTP